MIREKSKTWLILAFSAASGPEGPAGIDNGDLHAFALADLLGFAEHSLFNSLAPLDVRQIRIFRIFLRSGGIRIWAQRVEDEVEPPAAEVRSGLEQVLGAGAFPKK